MELTYEENLSYELNGETYEQLRGLARFKQLGF